MPEALTLGWRQYRLERRMFWRNPAAAFFNFLLPLALLALLGAVASGHQSGLNMILPGIAGMRAMTTTFIALAHNMTALGEAGFLNPPPGTPTPARGPRCGLEAGRVAGTGVGHNRCGWAVPAIRTGGGVVLAGRGFSWDQRRA